MSEDESEDEWFEEKIIPLRNEMRKKRKKLDQSLKELDNIVEGIRTEALEMQKRQLDAQRQKTEKALHVVETQELKTEVENVKALLLKKANLPKEPEKRIKALEDVQFQALKFLREKEVEVSGQDPDALFLGKSEDGKQDVYELYVKCKQCGKVFRTFKNQEFCSSICRYNWVKKNMIPEKPLIQEIFAERENENWDWVPVGNREGVTIYRRVFKEGEKKQ